MTSPSNLAILRLYVAEPDSVAPWTDDMLSEVLTRLSADLNSAASEIWGMKAARYSALVTVTEAGATRDLNKLFDHATSMAKLYKDRATSAVSVATGAPFTVAIERA